MKNTRNDIPQKTLHPRNKHNGPYDFKALIETSPDLQPFVGPNKFGNQSIDFADPQAVRALNKALLKHFYNIGYWELPKTNLCPPIPGRADYIHHIADLLAQDNKGSIPRGNTVKILDIGIGANCIYPIIGHKEYGWEFVGTEVDPPAKATAENIIKHNIQLKDGISIRLQENKRNIFKGIIEPEERFDFTICNPPFHNSKEEATKGTQRKLKNLGKASDGKPVLNFSGQNNELWYEGGELAFITNMIFESVHFKTQVRWFSTLVSKKENLKSLYSILKKVKVSEVKTITMEQGNKTTRILVWRY